MALKPITRQEQIIAGKNLEPITRMERFLKEYGGGSGGGAQSDWNQTDSSAADFIKNKPFGEMKGDTLTIPAYSTDEITAKMESGEIVLVDDFLVKVSDAIVSSADLSNGCTFTSDALDGAIDVPAEEIVYPVDGIIMPYDIYVFFVDESGVGVDCGDGLVFTEPGIYLYVEFLVTGVSLTIPGYTDFISVKPLDEKYLPNTVAKKNDLVQPDWGQTDETAIDYIKNKPVLNKDLSWTTVTTDIGDVRILTDPDTGETITRTQLADIINTYGIANISIGDKPVIAYVEASGYDAMTIYGSASFGTTGLANLNVYHIFTSDYLSKS